MHHRLRSNWYKDVCSDCRSFTVYWLLPSIDREIFIVSEM